MLNELLENVDDVSEMTEELLYAERDDPEMARNLSSALSGSRL
jgi:hypothetical protein